MDERHQPLTHSDEQLNALLAQARWPEPDPAAMARLSKMALSQSTVDAARKASELTESAGQLADSAGLDSLLQKAAWPTFSPDALARLTDAFASAAAAPPLSNSGGHHAVQVVPVSMSKEARRMASGRARGRALNWVWTAAAALLVLSGWAVVKFLVQSGPTDEPSHIASGDPAEKPGTTEAADRPEVDPLPSDARAPDGQLGPEAQPGPDAQRGTAEENASGEVTPPNHDPQHGTELPKPPQLVQKKRAKPKNLGPLDAPAVANAMWILEFHEDLDLASLASQLPELTPALRQALWNEVQKPGAPRRLVAARYFAARGTAQDLPRLAQMYADPVLQEAAFCGILRLAEGNQLAEFASRTRNGQHRDRALAALLARSDADSVSAVLRFAQTPLTRRWLLTHVAATDQMDFSPYEARLADPRWPVRESAALILSAVKSEQVSKRLSLQLGNPQLREISLLALAGRQDPSAIRTLDLAARDFYLGPSVRAAQQKWKALQSSTKGRS